MWSFIYLYRNIYIFLNVRLVQISSPQPCSSCLLPCVGHRQPVPFWGVRSNDGHFGWGKSAVYGKIHGENPETMLKIWETCPRWGNEIWGDHAIIMLMEKSWDMRKYDERWRNGDAMLLRRNQSRMMRFPWTSSISTDQLPKCEELQVHYHLANCGHVQWTSSGLICRAAVFQLQTGFTSESTDPGHVWTLLRCSVCRVA